MPVHRYPLSHRKLSVACSLVTVAMGLSVILLSPSPLTVLHRLNALVVLPPLWLLTLLHLAWHALFGWLLVSAFLGHRKSPAHEGELWRGCTCMSVALGMIISWYVLLFAKGAVLLSWMFLPSAGFLIVLCALDHRRFQRGSLIGYILLFFWPLMLSFLHLVVLLQA